MKNRNNLTILKNRMEGDVLTDCGGSEGDKQGEPTKSIINLEEIVASCLP
jgi:hypothetical protein